jgi:DNA polymerase sigma
MKNAHKEMKRPDVMQLRQLEETIQQFADSVTMSEDERQVYSDAIQFLRKVCSELEPSCKVILMGSYASDIIMSGGDVDIFVKTTQGTFIQTLHKQLLSESFVKSSMLIRGRVPVCRFRTVTGVQFDVNTIDDGSGNAQFVRNYIAEFPQMRPICFVLKTMIKTHGMSSGKSGGVPGIGLHYLVVSHLQNYERNFGQNINNVTLGQLMYDCLYFYAHQYDFQANIICVGTANYEKRKSGETVYFRDPTGDPRCILPGGTPSVVLIKKKFGLLLKVLSKNLEGTGYALDGIVNVQ